MGGNLLNTNVRIDKNTYKRIEKKVIKKLKKAGINYKLIPYYKEKESFGDLDILIEEDVNQKLINLLFKKNIFIKTNGSVISICIPIDKNNNTFQIDFIKAATSNFKIAAFYFSYNDLNNLVGKIAKQFNLKFGFDGLFYQYKKEDRKYNIFITKNPSRIYEILGFDYNKYLFGFSNLNDIYEYIINSKYFRKKIFLFENLNHKSKIREKKRNTYNGFLDYIKNIDENYDQIFDRYYENILNTQEIEKIKKEILILNKTEKITRELKKYINGKNIIETLQPKDFNDIKVYTNIIRNQLLIYYLKDKSQNEINELILKLNNKELN